MLTVKAILKQSNINNIGLFADEDISKGTIVWKFHPKFDIYFTKEEVKQMTDEQQTLISHYAYLSDKSGKYVYSIDDSRFTNHSSVSNNLDIISIQGELETAGVANRDIKNGEEILVNYRNFDAGDRDSKEEYLNN